MIQSLRQGFNARYTDGGYARLLENVQEEVRTPVGFRIAETPVFLPQVLMDQMVKTGQELTNQLLKDTDYLVASSASIPEKYRVAEPNAEDPPHFMTVDFGFVRESDGALGIRLVELQAFPSVFGFQDVLAASTVRAYELDARLEWHLGGQTRESYWALLRDVIVGGHDPVEVVLLEVEPERQKTRADFQVYQDRLSIATVDITKVRQTGRNLEYERNGRWLPIRRIFNRAIADEMERGGICPGFEMNADLDVEWAGHPNWYFRASKFALPFLRHPSVPRAVFLSDWMKDRSQLPLSLADTLLKPLFSFAGRGIQFAPSEAELRAIPEDQRQNYLLQERVHFEPVIATPHGLTQAEVRIMYVRRDGEKLQPAISMVRLGRGLMMGVDHNQNQAWVGASVALMPHESTAFVTR